MPIIDLTPAELRYLAKMNAESLSAMEFMTKGKGQAMPDLPMAQLHAKFTALLPEGVPDVFAGLHSRPTKVKGKQKRPVQKRPSKKKA